MSSLICRQRYQVHLKATTVGTGFGPVAFVAFGLRLGHEAGGLRPPLASPAPTSLACPHAEE